MNQGQISGSIKAIGNLETMTSKTGNMFYKRRMTLDATQFNVMTGERYENYPSLDFTGERCRELDNYAVGEKVTITYSLRGNGEYTSIRPYKIERNGEAVEQKPQQQPQQQSGYTTTRTDDYAMAVPKDFTPQKRKEPAYNPQDLPF